VILSNKYFNFWTHGLKLDVDKRWSNDLSSERLSLTKNLIIPTSFQKVLYDW